MSRDRRTLIGVVLTLLSLQGVGVWGLHAVGVPLLPWLHHPTQLHREEPRVTQVAGFTPAPAYDTLDTVLSHPPTGWEATTPMVQSAALPVQVLCVPEAASPVVALARQYTVGSVPVVATLVAYGPGQGAPAYATQSSAGDACGSSTSGVSTTITPTPWGAPSATLQLNSGGSSATTLLWQRGDVLAYVSVAAAHQSQLSTLGAALDSMLQQRLLPVCANEGSTPADSTRSPWVNSGAFTGLLQHPTITPTSTPAPTPNAAEIAAGATTVPLPALNPPIVVLPPTPTYPVYPPLPTPLSLPTLPTAPASPTTSITYPVRVDDPVGPGCGWAFTGAGVPVFNATTASQNAIQASATAAQQLQTSQVTYANEVASYWAQYVAFQSALQPYDAYATEVGRVSAIWASIGQEWSTYQGALNAYEAAVTARDALLQQQASAQNQYAAEQAACAYASVSASASATPSPSLSFSPTPTNSSTPSPSSTPSSTPTQTPPSSSLSPSTCPPSTPPVMTITPTPLPPSPTPPPNPTPSPTG